MHHHWRITHTHTRGGGGGGGGGCVVVVVVRWCVTSAAAGLSLAVGGRCAL